MVQERTAHLLAAGFRFLEAPKWRDDRLWMSDVFDHQLVSLSLDGRRDVVCAVPHRPGGQDFLPDGTHIVASALDQRLYRVRNGTLDLYADLSGCATCSLNDFAIDARGRIYLGDFGYDFHAGADPEPTRLYRIDPDGAVAVVAQDVHFPNGSVIVDNGATLIVAETWKCRIKAFDLSDRGELSNPRLFAKFQQAQPDGLCADAEGAIWVACLNTGEFLRVLDGGAVTDRIQIDGSPISCTLGGTAGRTLFMTALMGQGDDLLAGRNSAVLTAEVDVPRP